MALLGGADHRYYRKQRLPANLFNGKTLAEADKTHTDVEEISSDLFVEQSENLTTQREDNGRDTTSGTTRCSICSEVEAS
jgi:hypothetical protein